MPLIREFLYDYLLGMPLIWEFPYDYLLGMPLLREFLYDYLHEGFPLTNINSVQEIKHFIFQQIVDKPTALSNNFHAWIYESHNQYFQMSLDLWYGIVSCKSIYLYFRPLAWHKVL